MVWALVGWGIDHQLKALFGRGQLWDVVVGMGSADMLLHGTISFFLIEKKKEYEMHAV